MRCKITKKIYLKINKDQKKNILIDHYVNEKIKKEKKLLLLYPMLLGLFKIISNNENEFLL